MKLNDINTDTIYSYHKKPKSPFIKRSPQPCRLVSSHSSSSCVYKTKQQQQSLLPFNQLEKCFSIPSSNRNNNGIGGDCAKGRDCPNLYTIISLNTQIEKHKKTIEELTNLNNYFIYTLNQKDSMYRTLLQESTLIKANASINTHVNSNANACYDTLYQDHLKFTSSSIINRPKSVFISSSSNINNSNRKFNNKCNSVNNHSTLSNYSSMKNSNYYIQDTSPRANHHYYHSKSNFINDLHSNQPFNKKKGSLTTTAHPDNHYDNLLSILSNSTTRNTIQNSSISYLSMSKNKLKECERNEYIEFLTKITKSESEFNTMIKVDNEGFISDLCDSIRTITKDFKQVIRLLVRLKIFLKTINDLVNSQLQSNFNDVILSNATTFLNCDYAQLYLYNPISDMLDVYRIDEGINTISQSTIPKDYGIIGNCFSKGECIKIDDTATDIKCKSITIKKHIRNIMYYPLKATYDNDNDNANNSDKTHHSEVFGILEVSNKRGEAHFNTDDEELIVLFSNVLSVLIQNNNKKEENEKTLMRYDKIIKYSIDIQAITNKSDFNEKTEELLNALFYSTKSRLLFVDIARGKMLNRNNKVIEMNSNLGIVYHVMKSKQCYACAKAKNCKYYNTLIDIDTSEALITYPLIINNECIGIIQIILNDQIDTENELPKNKEMKVLNLIDKCIINWCKTNIADFNNSPNLIIL